MAWIVLIISSGFEAVWATALGMSDGFSHLLPSIIFLGALAISMGGLALAMRKIPTGTAYAVWTGIGAVLTVTYAMLSGNEAVSPAKIGFLTLIVGCVIGLKLVDLKVDASGETHSSEDMAVKK